MELRSSAGVVLTILPLMLYIIQSQLVFSTHPRRVSAVGIIIPIHFTGLCVPNISPVCPTLSRGLQTLVYNIFLNWLHCFPEIVVVMVGVTLKLRS